MIDCHAHLVDNKFKNDIEEVIELSIKSGVQKAVVVPEYVSQFEKVIELKRKFPEFVIASIGIHPIQKNKRSVRLSDLTSIESFISSHQEEVQCIGEVGLDFTTSQFKISEDDFKVQEEVLKYHVQLAKTFDLPLNVHTRSAASKCLELLASEQAQRVVLHAFGGDDEDIKKGLSLGYYFSVPPSYSLKEYGENLVRLVPTKQILLETDSPVLGHIKGERNIPANCSVSAEFIAKIKSASKEEIIKQTTKNASLLFNL